MLYEGHPFSFLCMLQPQAVFAQFPCFLKAPVQRHRWKKAHANQETEIRLVSLEYLGTWASVVKAHTLGWVGNAGNSLTDGSEHDED